MSVNISPLFAPVVLTGSAATYFTALVPTQILKMTVSNPNAAAYPVTIYWVPSGGTAGAANVIVPARYLQTNESWDVWPFIGQVLGIGDLISAFCGTASKVVFFASGTTVSGS